MLNVLIAVTWMFFYSSFTSSRFIVGYLLGALLILLFRRFFKDRFYLLVVWAVIKLVVLFFKELILANVDVLKHIIRPKLAITPGIFAMETKLSSDWEVTLLANLITLTPGTLVVDISDDNKTLYIHAIHLPDADEAINGIRNTFEKAILEVTGK